MEKVGYRHVRFQQIHTDLTFLYGYVWNVQQKMFWFLMASVWICNSFWGMPHWTIRTPEPVWFCMEFPTEENLVSVCICNSICGIRVCMVLYGISYLVYTVVLPQFLTFQQNNNAEKHKKINTDVWELLFCCKIKNCGRTTV